MVVWSVIIYENIYSKEVAKYFLTVKEKTQKIAQNNTAMNLDYDVH